MFSRLLVMILTMMTTMGIISSLYINPSILLFLNVHNTGDLISRIFHSAVLYMEDYLMRC